MYIYIYVCMFIYIYIYIYIYNYIYICHCAKLDLQYLKSIGKWAFMIQERCIQGELYMTFSAEKVTLMKGNLFSGKGVVKVL